MLILPRTLSLSCSRSLVLSLVLQHIAAQGISHRQVRALVKRVDLSRIEREPPTAQAATEELALQLVSAEATSVDRPSRL